MAGGRKRQRRFSRPATPWVLVLTSSFLMTEIPANLRKLAQQVGGDEAPAFLEAMVAGESRRPALAWLRERPQPPPFAVEPPRAWQPDWVDGLAVGEAAGRHPLHEAGHCYCLDLSSVFTGRVFMDLPAGLRVLDLCAAPGGKSLLAWRALRPRELWCNETIRKRTAPLIDNLRRCRIPDCRVTSLDPAELAQRAPGAFDLVIVDAPCSGQSLMARGRPAPGGFHPATINMNSRRQRRLIAEASRCVRAGGWLAYITCTFSPRENEGVLQWFLRRRADFRPLEVPALRAFSSRLADFPCHRLLPQQGHGAGGFCALLQNQAEPGPAPEPPPLPLVWSPPPPRPGDQD